MIREYRLDENCGLSSRIHPRCIDLTNHKATVKHHGANPYTRSWLPLLQHIHSFSCTFGQAQTDQREPAQCPFRKKVCRSIHALQWSDVSPKFVLNHSFGDPVSPTHYSGITPRLRRMNPEVGVCFILVVSGRQKYAVSLAGKHSWDERIEIPWRVLTSKHEAATPVADGQATMVSQHRLYKRDGPPNLML
jgi:hypothetical protein